MYHQFNKVTTRCLGVLIKYSSPSSLQIEKSLEFAFSLRNQLFMLDTAPNLADQVEER